MLVIVLPDAQAVARRAADLVADLIARKPDAVLGLAAGATPVGMYDELVRRRADGLEFSRTTLFGLDEYLDLAADHPASCAWALRHHFITPIGADPARVHLLGTPTGDPAAYCAAYDRAIADAGGLDLQILGLGVNGHIGFNEPGCSLGGRTHVTGLSAATRATNRPLFPPPDDVPPMAITMGVATILAARQVLMLATGSAKAAMVATFVEGPLTARVPASALQLHENTVVLLDESAAAGLRFRADYETEVAAVFRPFAS